jgi:hypothetical protein
MPQPSRDATDSEWYDFETRLRGEHLKGREVTITIKSIVVEETHPQPGKAGVMSPVAYFERTNKSLVLSPRNQRKLAELFGAKVGNCIGKKVKLRAEPQKVGGRMTLPIHIEAANHSGSADTLDASTGELTVTDSTPAPDDPAEAEVDA